MRYLFLLLIIIVAGIILLFFALTQKNILITPFQKKALKIIEKPLEKYAFERLKTTHFEKSNISIGKQIKETPSFSSFIFYFKTNKKKVSGVVNVPASKGEYPLLVMFRGFVEKEKYTPGEGTRHSAEVFAGNGFITLAPDFLGYGESDNPSKNSIEERFQTYTTSLSLLSSLKNINKALEESSQSARTNLEHIGIWGHSNGGQIAISTLELSGKTYPTVLWNPVTKPFPYSILYFTDEFDDHGKALRKAVADFEKDYNAELYSPSNYYSWINAPLQLHQGVDDEAVPLRWSNQFYDEMKKLKKDIDYFTYPGEDHNFSKGSWNLAVERSINFFRTNFKEK